MSDDDTYERKKLSLKGNRTVIKPTIQAAKKNIASERPLTLWEKEIAEINIDKAVIQEKIDHIEQRLVFGYSETLKESAVDYKREVMVLECKVTDILLVNA
jgi:hypothetical protein